MTEMEQLEEMCRAVPPPDPQRLAGARARVLAAIAEGQGPASRAARGWPWLATRAPGRWRGLVAPLAAAAAVTAVVAGALAVAGVIHGAGVTPSASLAHQAIAYVTNQGSGTVTPIRAATNTAGKPVKVGREPVTIAVTPDGETAYVVNNGPPGTVTPIRAANDTALTPIKVGRSPVAIAITPDGKTAYVANYGYPGSVTPIRTATNTALTPLKTGQAPGAIAITRSGRRALRPGDRAR